MTEPTRRRPPVIADVARVAGVSVPTVSRVITGSTPVSAAKRAQVMAAIDELGYRPNAAARALVSGRHSMISVLAGNTTRYGYAATLQGVEEAARAAGYLVVITVVESDEQAVVDSVVDLVLGQAVAGVVVLEFDAAGIAAARALPESVPVVTVSATRPGEHDRPHADLDDRSAAAEAVDYLLGMGHRTVHHVSIPSSGPEVGRTLGWRDALAAAGAPEPEPMAPGWHPAAGYEAGVLLAQDPAVTAVLAGNDQLAIGLMRAFMDAGRSVPQDVSVVGFDDEPFAAMWSPPLTTVAQDFVGLGRRAFGMLMDLARTGRSTARSTAIPPLVLRGSAAPPPARQD
ncbi:LacI family DNA-binding transcriptional regulator [Cellulomonas chengniuliangii]|uniref:LacI family DNA-binding transcriptional regulator n=1 Tax=Cellulomonas chengniuliangii TaxID=2968084 RepID=A0ABY5KZT6_9CELL|nr:LacI family DNA-binding transcriptional regulator [Cellulomonas chengniuliangii]MCC2309521.1 LacI family DNA-binding transcriptional regulator [Cellulomonas chengniuliangii]MCC2316792.1 LacI family DNA-binding transcriptional regulator [Cellulomonas chengniuliangii]UUI74921.1 LacI family DNA-binding transcriptional regulator [Cellulomonas chengniuliangii]